MKRIPLAGLVAATLWSGPLAAQSFWTHPTHERGISLEVLKPNYASQDEFDPEFSFSTFAIFLSGRISLSEATRVVADLPFAHGTIDREFGESTSSSVIGNPYLGLEVGRLDGAFLELGLRAPLAKEFGEDDFAYGVGTVSDFDRFEAFLPDLLSVAAIANVQHRSATGLGLRLRGGGIYSINTDDDARDDENNLLLSYGAQAWYDAGPARFGGVVTGRWNVTVEDRDFGEASIHQLGLTADAAVGGVRPGVLFRMPLDENFEGGFRSVIGLYLHVPLR